VGEKGGKAIDIQLGESKLLNIRSSSRLRKKEARQSRKSKGHVGNGKKKGPSGGTLRGGGFNKFKNEDRPATTFIEAEGEKEMVPTTERGL